MLFSSIPFLYYFLPLVLLVYFIAPNKLKNLVLVFFSLFFYGWGEPIYLILMVGAIIMGYVFGRLIERFQGQKLAKIFLTVSLISNVVMLAYFKYVDFFITNINKFSGLSLSLLKIALPIGISFYLFQIASYTLDVYWGRVPAQKNMVCFAEFVSFFPQLIAGPIVRYADIADQIQSRQHSFDKIAQGIRRFVLGLSKKILLANALGQLCDIFRASNDKSVLFYWLYAFSFSLQIYFDFSGYSDMAIGLGKVFGFDFIENFNYPYISQSITEFWRRWHISLGSWFRDYVYIPLGGNRVSAGRWYFNILLVWILTGFWHGAAWNFIFWGLLYAFFLILEKAGFSRFLAKVKGLTHAYVLLVVMLGFVLFNASDLSDALSYYGAMFGLQAIPLISTEFIYYLKSYGLILLVAILASTPLVRILMEKIKVKVGGRFPALVIGGEILAMVGLFLLTTAYLVDGSFNPFLYFRF